MLYLRTAAEVQQAADAIIDRVKMNWPQARIHGLQVQSMANRAGAQELRVVVESDPVFGPLSCWEKAASSGAHRSRPPLRYHR
jgi:acetyltransferase